jgi:O-antigen/teichoic acid export membrane protein
LIRFFSERSYWDAYRVVPLVGAAYIFYSWTIVMDASFYVTKRTFYKMHSIFIAGGIVLVLYWLLIPRFGMMGAAWATLGGYVSYAAFDAFYAQRVYRIHYQLKRIALLFAAGVLLYELGNLVPVTPIIAGMIIRSAVILTFPIILWLSGFVTPGERRRVAQHWRTLRSRYFGGSDKLNEAAVTRVPH